MTLRIAIGPTHNFDSRMWLDINDTDYEVVTQGPIDLHFLDPLCKTVPSDLDSKLPCVILDIWHNTENQIQRIVNKKYKETWITNAWDPHVTDPNIIFNDFLFNRTKAYYTQYAFKPGTLLWYYHHNIAFHVPRLTLAESKQKIFVCPAKTYNGTRKYRQQLVNHISNFQSLGYLGNYDQNPNLFLYSHLEFPFPDIDINKLSEQTRPMSYNSWGYCPPHSAYYTNSFISVYTESIETGRTIAITEKTWDPLIRGHFILPFSSTGYVQRLKQLGVKLPDFIDYSYDLEPVDTIRWDKYRQELDRLLNMDLDTWRQHWTDNLNLLLDNQRYFQRREYDRIDLKTFL